ncbi:nicotinate (nicotinamide) nucleotide adenylyltransferase [Ramlibacter sp.]|uniref:nicotinate (nicotinamide) nucleotide adenylyltransferase n=1 Tax=Ramlibacter sp. TaxID=1917967 RepID=UPI003D13030A
MGLKLGLFGGSFDPPHHAHVALATAAVQQVPLDALHVLPTGDAWYKPRQLTDAAHRLEMTRIAFAAVPQARVDDREMRRAGPSYTIDTLRELRLEEPAAELYLVMGEDQAAAFATWREWTAIAEIATLAIARRDYAGATQPPLALPPGVRHVELRLPLLPGSASDVRRRLAAGQAIDVLVDPRVASYIDHHHLYQPD